MKRVLPMMVLAAAVCAGCNKAYSPVAPNGPDATDPKDMALISEKGQVALTSDNTRITFAGTDPGGKLNGGFKSVRGELQLLMAAPGMSPPPEKRTVVQSMQVEIDTDSLWADDDKLTQQLKGDDLLQPKKHPTITFKSTAIVPSDPKSYTEMLVTGDLTLRGVTRTITFPARVDKKLGFYLTCAFKMNRKDFGLPALAAKGPADAEINISLTVGHAPEAPKT